MQTIVIGHKNPDMDSICSALGYARLKERLGVPGVVAGRAGNTNERVDFVLAKFGWEPPVFFSDVSPRVSDVMVRDVVRVRAGAPLYEAVQVIDRESIRALPVVDAEERMLGLLSSFKVGHHLVPPREEALKARTVYASLADLVSTIEGRVFCGEPDLEGREHFLVVAAMDSAAFDQRLPKLPVDRMILFVNDRPDIQLQAIEAGVRTIVITGGVELRPGVARIARQAGTLVVGSPFDSASTVLYARAALPVERLVDANVSSFHPDTPLDEARGRAAMSGAPAFPVIDDDGRLTGILTKSDFLKPVGRQLILVDHNELAQAVNGAGRIPVVEILDHHKLGGFSTATPILFWNNPVGSTCTLVALSYRQAGVPVEPRVAGLLMAGLIADTLNLTSPTATEVDREVLLELAALAGVEPAALASEIFSVGSPLLTLKAADAIRADAKDYDEEGHRFAVAQIEEIGFANYPDREAELLAALAEQRRSAGMLFAALLVTDVNTQNSLLLVDGAPEFLETIGYPQRGPNVWEMPGVVSRKKQLLPYLLRCLHGMKAIGR
jgi:manganese-dependent inorganic pyrophosphatase